MHRGHDEIRQATRRIPLPTAYTLKEVRLLLRISHETLTAECRAGRLAYYIRKAARLPSGVYIGGGGWMIPAAELERWALQRAQEQQAKRRRSSAAWRQETWRHRQRLRRGSIAAQRIMLAWWLLLEAVHQHQEEENVRQERTTARTT